MIVRSETDDEGFRVTVHNRGKPIPEDLVPALFEPMVPGAAAGAGQGVGLGLFIVREIARGHGGAVRVRSGPDGTFFTIAVPRA